VFAERERDLLLQVRPEPVEVIIIAKDAPVVREAFCGTMVRELSAMLQPAPSLERGVVVLTLIIQSDDEARPVDMLPFGRGACDDVPFRGACDDPLPLRGRT
jgi:hypothetical protein